MRCKKCNEKNEEYAIFCHKCGKTTDALKTRLSAKDTIKSAWEKFKPKKSQMIPEAILMTFLAIVPIIILYFANLTDNYYLSKVKYILFTPFLMIAFGNNTSFKDRKYGIKNYFANLKYYPKFLVFAFLNFLYFFILRFLCSGKPFIYYSYDPILNIVFLVMTLYWYAIIVPTFGLIMKKNFSCLKSIYVAYKAGQETRWQQFFIFGFIGIMAMVSVLTFGLGFLITIPFSFFILEEYYDRMNEYKLFELPKNSKDKK